MLELILSLPMHSDNGTMVQPYHKPGCQRLHTLLRHHLQAPPQPLVPTGIQRHQTDRPILNHSSLAVRMRRNIVLLILVPVGDHLIVTVIFLLDGFVEGDELFGQGVRVGGCVVPGVHVGTVGCVG